jgi:hypothetical protein
MCDAGRSTLMDPDAPTTDSSDMQQVWDRPAPEATVPAAPTPPTPPGGAGAAAKGVPVWALLVVALVSVAVAGTGAYLVARSGVAATELELAGLKAKSLELEAQIAALRATVASAEATKAAALSATSDEEAPVVTPTPATTVKQFTFIRKLTGNASAGWTLTADYAQFLTGSAAAAAATAHGDESPPPNDYYIVNDNPKLRTFKLASPVKITVLGWGGTDSTAKKDITAAQFASVLPPASADPHYAEAPYWITITGSAVVKIEQVYLP